MSEYLPVYAEEIFIVQMYGSDEEIKEFDRLMENPQAQGNLVAIVLLIEEIKRRSLLKMNWYCCWRCERYATCKINWHRGERHYERRNCCTYCQNFWECHKKFLDEQKRQQQAQVESQGTGADTDPAGTPTVPADSSKT